MDISLHYVCNHVLTVRLIDQEVLNVLHEICDLGLQMWKLERENKADILDSGSSNKVKEHGIKLSSDEINEEELKQAFPDYVEVFVLFKITLFT